MNNDINLIAGLRQAFKSSSTDLCKAYNDFAQKSISEALRAVLDGQLRIASKLSSLENLYSSGRNNEPQATSSEINSYKNSQFQ